jgi:hypothetical protein
VFTADLPSRTNSAHSRTGVLGEDKPAAAEAKVSAVVNVVEWAREMSVRATCTCIREASVRPCFVGEARTGCLPARRRVAAVAVAVVAPAASRIPVAQAECRLSCLVGWERQGSEPVRTVRLQGRLPFASCARCARRSPFV